MVYDLFKSALLLGTFFLLHKQTHVFVLGRYQTSSDIFATSAELYKSSW